MVIKIDSLETGDCRKFDEMFHGTFMSHFNETAHYLLEVSNGDIACCWSRWGDNLWRPVPLRKIYHTLMTYSWYPVTKIIASIKEP